MINQNTYKLMKGNISQADTVETLNFEPIKGYPMLNWRGKRPFTSTHFYPAQLKEQHGSETDGWLNKIYWGDNLQVMSHLLKHYRGKVDLVYIDPPFDSKADYKKKISLRGKAVESSTSSFEEKQYTDIWNNDEYLQFIYERLVIIRELMSERGSLYFHVGPNVSQYCKIVLDEIFGPSNYINEIVWRRAFAHNDPGRCGVIHDAIYLYSKSSERTWNKIFVKPTREYVEMFFDQYDSERKERYSRQPLDAPRHGNGGNLIYEWKGVWPAANRTWAYSKAKMEAFDQAGKIHYPKAGVPRLKRYESEFAGTVLQDIWLDINKLHNQSTELSGYPTQKPESLLERIISASSNPGDLVFDCFMGSGTTQSAAMKLGRRFIGADINLGSIQTTTKRLIGVAEEVQNRQKMELDKPEKSPTLVFEDEAEEVVIEDIDAINAAPSPQKPNVFYTGFETYNVNNYEVFRNPIEAKDILIEALELQKLQAGHLFDGERDGRMWKIMPVNKIATRQDLNEIIAGLNLKSLADRLQLTPNQPAEKITLVCMGHEPDLAATLNQEVALNLNVKAGTKMPLDVQVLDILRERDDLQFKRDSEARVSIKKDQLVIEAFYPMNLLSKLSLQKEKVGDWREMVDSVMVDFNYDGAVFNPGLVDIPEKNALVAGSYPVPTDAGTIRVKITDVLSESLELEVQA